MTEPSKRPALIIGLAAVAVTALLLLTKTPQGKPKVVPYEPGMTLKPGESIEIPLGVGTAAPADICTGNYFYQQNCDTQWWAAWGTGGYSVAQGPGSVTLGGCSAHVYMIVGSDWRWYAIITGGHINPQGYKRPSDNGVAAALWDKCFAPGGPRFIETGYDCGVVNPPSGPQVYQMKTLAQVTGPLKASYTALFRCSVPQTPGPTVSPASTPPGGCPPCPCGKTPTVPPASTPPPRPTRPA